MTKPKPNRRKEWNPNRRKEWNKRMIAEGRCLVCAKKTPKNKRTGKPMYRCRVHQDEANQYNKKLKAKSRLKLRQERKLAAKKLKAKRLHDAEVKRLKRLAAKEGQAGVSRD